LLLLAHLEDAALEPAAPVFGQRHCLAEIEGAPRVELGFKGRRTLSLILVIERHRRGYAYHLITVEHDEE